jgi:hypothetical protein
MGVEDRHGSPTFRDVHPGDLEVSVVNTIEGDATCDETLGSDPRFDDKYAARAEMASHATHGFPKSGERPRVADRAEKACDHIKPAPKIEVDEGAPMQANPWTTLARDGQHVAAHIESLHTKPAAQMLQMTAGTTPHVK